MKQEERLKAAEAKLEEVKLQLETKKNEGKDVSGLSKRLKGKREAVTRQRQRIKDMKAKQAERLEKLKQSLDIRKQRDVASLEKMKLRIIGSGGDQRLQYFNVPEELRGPPNLL